MNSSINLLDYKNKVVVTKKVSEHKTLRIIAMLFLFGVSACSVIIFILIALSPLPELEKQRKVASFNLSLQNQDIIKLALVNERVDAVQNVLGSRSNYHSLIEDFQSKLPSGVTIDTFNIKDEGFSVILESNSLLQLEEFINQFSKSIDENNKYKSLIVSSLSAASSGNKYILSLKIN